VTESPDGVMSVSCMSPRAHIPSRIRLTPRDRDERLASSHPEKPTRNEIAELRHRRRRGRRGLSIPRVFSANSADGFVLDEGILDVLAGASAARRPGDVNPNSADDAVVFLEGTGTHLGMRSTWRLAHASGKVNALAFADEVVLVPDGIPGASATPLESRSGFDPSYGKGEGKAWAEALGGGVRRSEFQGADGEHRSTLVSWIRTGQWLEDAARGSLHVKLLRSGVPLKVLVEEHSMAREAPEREAVETFEPGRSDDARPSGKRLGKRGKTRARVKDRNAGGGFANRIRAPRRDSGDTDATEASARSNASVPVSPPIVLVPNPPSVPKGPGVLVAAARRGGRVGARLWLRRVGAEGAADDVASFKAAYTTDASERFETDSNARWWVVHRAEFALPEGVEVWVFDGYAFRADARIAAPSRAHQTVPGGDRCEYLVTSVRAIDPAARETFDSLDALSFASRRDGFVTDPRWPTPTFRGLEDASGGDWTAAAKTRAARGEGGHAFLRPTLNGVLAPGWFALDTASRGNVIDSKYADALHMPAFGRIAVVGAAAASLSGALRRGNDVALGALTLPSPLFMEQALTGAARCPEAADAARTGARLADGQGALLGTLGTDFLQHCVLEMRAPKRTPGSPSPAKFEVFVHHPATFFQSTKSRAADVADAWQRVTWISGAPHVRVRVSVSNDALTEKDPPAERRLSPVEPRRTLGGFEGEAGVSKTDSDAAGEADAWSGRLFRLSLGFGGCGAIVAHRAAAEWNMLERTVGLQPGGVLSAAGEDRARFARVDPEVVTGRLAELEFKGASFATVRALTHVNGDPPDLNFSPHVDGALCADLFRGCDLILDLGNDRIAVVQRDR